MAWDSADNQHVRNAAITDLAGGATLANVITKVNEILAALRQANIISG